MFYFLEYLTNSMSDYPVLTLNMYSGHKIWSEIASKHRKIALLSILKVWNSTANIQTGMPVIF